jgi:hypothetical protein
LPDEKSLEVGRQPSFGGTCLAAIVIESAKQW